MLIDQLGDDVLSSEHSHVLDEASVVDVPDTERLDVWIDDGGCVEDKGAEHYEELVEAAANGFPCSEKRKSWKFVKSSALKSM